MQRLICGALIRLPSSDFLSVSFERMQADAKKNTKKTKTDADGQSSNSLTVRCKIKKKNQTHWAS